MKSHIKAVALASLLSVFLLGPYAESKAQTGSRQGANIGISLVGAWTLTAADILKPDGTRANDYGPDPQGILVFEPDGRYTIQIFRADRLKFASGDRAHGTPEEYRDASLGMSCHFGHYSVDDAKGTITFRIERASFSNLDGVTQTRPFTLTGDELSWRVTARPDGSIPISVWRRVR